MVDFMFKPTVETAKGPQSILHMTDKKEENTASYGGRIPALWLDSFGRLRIECARDNIRERTHFLQGLHVGNWTQITVTQEYSSKLLKSRYRVLIDGVERVNVENAQEGEFRDVRVYASNPWHDAQSGFIKDLSVKGKM